MQSTSVGQVIQFEFRFQPVQMPSISFLVPTLDEFFY